MNMRFQRNQPQASPLGDATAECVIGSGGLPLPVPNACGIEVVNQYDVSER